MADTSSGTPASVPVPIPDPVPELPAPAPVYTVNRAQDGAVVRAELSLDEAQGECNILNAQARIQTGLTAPVFDERRNLVQAAQPIYGSMFHGEIARYEVRSADGLVVA